MIEHAHPDGEPTPTVRELYERKDGSAEVVDWVTPKGGKPTPTRFRLTPKGQAIISEIMRRNVAASMARGTVNEEAGAAMRASAGTKGEGDGSKGKSTPS